MTLSCPDFFVRPWRGDAANRRPAGRRAWRRHARGAVRARPDRAGAGAAALPRAGDHRARAARDLRAHLAVRRSRLRPRAARLVSHHERRRPARARRPRPRPRAARVPQRLPPPRLAPAHRLGHVRQGDPLPVPRLDVPPRRHAHRRAGGARDRGPRQVAPRAAPGPRRGALRTRLRQPRPRGRASLRTAWPSSSASAAARAAPRSPRTGRLWSRTTSRATTSRSRTRR
jgi:hypothetical protein